MTQTHTFCEYVRTRLGSWGHHFALHRDCEYLGHQSKNMLQVLIAPSKMPTSSRCFQPDANLDANLGAVTVRLMPTYQPFSRAHKAVAEAITTHMMSNRLGQVGTPVQVNSGAAFSDANLADKVGTGRHHHKFRKLNGGGSSLRGVEYDAWPHFPASHGVF